MKIVEMHFFHCHITIMTLILLCTCDLQSLAESLDCPPGWMDEEFENGVHSCVPKSIVVEPTIKVDPCPIGAYQFSDGSCSDVIVEPCPVGTPHDSCGQIAIRPPPKLEANGTWIWDMNDGTLISSHPPPCPKDWFENEHGYCAYRYGYPSVVQGRCPDKTHTDIYGKCRQYLQ